MARALGGLAHLLVGFIQSHDASANRGELGSGHYERFAIHGIEPLCDIPGQFKMLALVFADRYDRSLVQ